MNSLNSINNSKRWTNVQFDLLSKWLLEIEIYINMNNDMSIKYNKYNKLINIPTIIINSLIATTTFATIGRKDEILWLELMIGFASIIATIFATLNSFLNYGSLSELHNSASTQYNILKNDIEDQISRPTEFRENATLYITRIKSEYNKLLHSNLQISPDIKNQYNNINTTDNVNLDIDSTDNVNLSDNKYQIINVLPDIDVLPGTTKLQVEFERSLKNCYEEAEVKRIQYELSKLNNV
jgi:hypothetical protein